MRAAQSLLARVARLSSHHRMQERPQSAPGQRVDHLRVEAQLGGCERAVPDRGALPHEVRLGSRQPLATQPPNRAVRQHADPERAELRAGACRAGYSSGVADTARPAVNAPGRAPPLLHYLVEHHLREDLVQHRLLASPARRDRPVRWLQEAVAQPASNLCKEALRLGPREHEARVERQVRRRRLADHRPVPVVRLAHWRRHVGGKGRVQG
mmetsp:Transcript_15871/g.47153  ORF Transcript_15871/g.47153 Transcript_15871/m.47153 type:complete len:211 (-) Transcript_15871:634-1266(-)